MSIWSVCERRWRWRREWDQRENGENGENGENEEVEEVNGWRRNGEISGERISCKIGF